MTTETMTTDETTESPVNAQPFHREPFNPESSLDGGRAPVLHLCDRELLCAMSVSLCCPDWPDARRVNDWLPGVTEGDLRWAQRAYEVTCVVQRADVDRLIADSDFAGTDFFEDGVRERLRAAWGTRRRAALGAIAGLQDHARAGRPCPAC